MGMVVVGKGMAMAMAMLIELDSLFSLSLFVSLWFYIPFLISLAFGSAFTAAIFFIGSIPLIPISRLGAKTPELGVLVFSFLFSFFLGVSRCTRFTFGMYSSYLAGLGISSCILFESWESDLLLLVTEYSMSISYRSNM
jgi:hypothetical protein